ncbi:MAG: AAA family ATPase, partial [Acidimicrobiales bacterium]
MFEFEGCVLDTTKQELWRDGEVEHVEPQVLAVIEYLAINNDRVVTKIELLDEVWGDRFVSESALTSRIKLARRACGDSGRAQRVIKTIHSRGYRMVAAVTSRDVSGTGLARREAEPDTGTEPAPLTEPTTSRRGASTSVFGRDQEIAALDAALAGAASGRREVVFVCGGMGSGKSTLVAEFLERHDHLEEWNVARGQCLEMRGGTEPYFCLLDAISNLAQEDEAMVRSTLVRSAPSWLNQLPFLVDDVTSEQLERRLLGSTDTRMLREGADALALLAAAQPLLLILEDLHLADDCTLDVLELLLRRSDTCPLLLIGTARPDSTELASVIGPAVARGDAMELQLSPLAEQSISALVADRTDAQEVPDDLVALVTRRCEGIPLFAEEIVAAWTRDGLIEVVDGRVNVVGDVGQLEATIPATLPPLIERELASLDAKELAVLQACAAAGDTFDAAAIAAATSTTVADTEQLLGSIERRHGLISALGASSWPDGTISATYGFSHALFREVIHDLMPASVRAAVHARIARELEEAWGDEADELAIPLADHYLEAGETLRAVEHLRRAGERAGARSAHRHAAEFLTDALSRLEDVPVSAERDRAECLVRAALGPALVASNGWF